MAIMETIANVIEFLLGTVGIVVIIACSIIAFLSSIRDERMKDEQKNGLRDHWYDFMRSDEWVVFMNVVRILTFVAIIILIIIMIKEIEAIKLLAYDPCEICMNKTGAQCFLRR